jgi:hypothetical protein
MVIFAPSASWGSDATLGILRHHLSWSGYLWMVGDAEISTDRGQKIILVPYIADWLWELENDIEIKL